MASKAGVFHLKDYFKHCQAWEGRLINDPADPTKQLILTHRCELVKSKRYERGTFHADFERQRKIGWTNTYRLIETGGAKEYFMQGFGALFTTEAHAVRCIARLYQQLSSNARQVIAKNLTIGAGLDSGNYWSLALKPVRVVRTESQIQNYYAKLFSHNHPALLTSPN